MLSCLCLSLKAIMTDYTAGIFIINNKNEILLTHATNSAIKYWGIPKGLADVGETHLAAAIREVEEETGIKFTNPNKVHFLGNMKYKNGPKVLAAFYVFLEDLDPSDLVLLSKDSVYFMNDLADAADAAK